MRPGWTSGGNIAGKKIGSAAFYDLFAMIDNKVHPKCWPCFIFRL
jgi:hypothetical protein